MELCPHPKSITIAMGHWGYDIIPASRVDKIAHTKAASGARGPMALHKHGKEQTVNAAHKVQAEAKPKASLSRKAKAKAKPKASLRRKGQVKVLPKPRPVRGTPPHPINSNCPHNLSVESALGGLKLASDCSGWNCEAPAAENVSDEVIHHVFASDISRFAMTS